MVINLLSPGVAIQEVDLTEIIPAVSSSIGALAGVFRWGPVNTRYLVSSEQILANTFGLPTNFNAETYFTVSNFLTYGNSVFVSRAANTTGVTPYFTCNSSAANLASPNATFVVASGNTNNLTVGMYITQSSNSTILNAANNISVNSIVNSTAFTLNANVTSNGNLTLYFGNPGTAYTALAFDNTYSSNGFATNLVNNIVTNNNIYTSKDGTFDLGVVYLARWPGALGNSLRVSQCDSANSFSANVIVGNSSTNVAFGFVVGNTAASAQFSGVSNVVANTFAQSFITGDNVQAGNSSIGLQFLQVANVQVNTSYNSNTLVTINFTTPYRLSTNWSANTVLRLWEFWAAVNQVPGQSLYVQQNGNTSANDLMHVVVVDQGGAFTGTPGSILERWTNVSRATDSQNLNGTNNYYKNVINQGSRYIWYGADRLLAPSANSALVASSTATVPGYFQCNLGNDGYNEAAAPMGILGMAFDTFLSQEDVTIDLVMQGKPTGGTTVVGGQTIQNFQLSNYIIQNLVQQRKDCVAFVSPPSNLMVNNFGYEWSSLVNWRGALPSTSYAVMDTGYKYQYDQYNNVYRYIPMNGDIAGLCARTDSTNAPWWSPAGLNRGILNNVITLPYNPKQADRDQLYPNNVNPVISTRGQGTYLFGDKTLQTLPSAFDRINVRRLFIYLERAISQAAKYFLFEFNDPITRANFVNMVTPFLKEVKGHRGIIDFFVQCDADNNPPQVVMSNQFVASIYIKPNYSINFITLTFVAVPQGVAFSSVVGNF